MVCNRRRLAIQIDVLGKYGIIARHKRSKVKRIPSSYTKIQERTPCEITNKQMTKLSINSPPQVETTSRHLKESMKIEEVPDTSIQPTLRVFQKISLNN